MNTIQQLSEVASQLPAASQEDLLAYAQHMLEHGRPPAPDEAEIERERQIQQLILDRYVAYKASGRKGTPANEVITELKQKYGIR